MYILPYRDNDLLDCISLNGFFDYVSVNKLTALGAYSSCHDYQDDCDFPSGELVDYAYRAILSAYDYISAHINRSICQENITERTKYPHGCSMIQCSGSYKSITLERDKFESLGKIEYNLVGTYDVVYSDNDGDGFYEKAYIVISDGNYETDKIILKFNKEDNCKSGFVDTVLCVNEVGGEIVIEVDSIDLINPNSIINDSPFPSKTQLDICCVFVDGVPQDDCVFVKTIDVYEKVIVTDCYDVKMIYNKKCICSYGCESVTKPACLQRTGLCNQFRIVPINCDQDDNESCTCKCTGLAPDYIEVDYVSSGYKPAIELVYILAATMIDIPHCVTCGCNIGHIENYQQIPEYSTLPVGYTRANKMLESLDYGICDD